MKLSLFILSCCIVATWQQNPYFWSRYHQPASSYGQAPLFQQYNLGPFYPQYDDSIDTLGGGAAPYPYSSNYFSAYRLYLQDQQRKQLENTFLARLVAQRFQQANQPQSHPEVEIDSQLRDELAAQVLYQMLQKSQEQKGQQQPQAQKESAEEIESRGFLWPLVIGAQIFSTSTKYTFTTSTITSTSVISCIAAASFYGGSTQSCRRKRDAIDIRALFDAEDSETGALLAPTPVASVEPTQFVEGKSLDLSSDVVSSLQENQAREGVLPERYLSLLRGQEQQVQGRNFGSTITSTLTTYSIYTTASKKTVTIGSSLSCLPSGYSVC